MERRMSGGVGRRLRNAGVALFFATSAFAQQAPASPFLRVDPEKILVSNSTTSPCGECHTQEVAVWKETKHAKGFDTMHRTESARDILTAMNFRVTKRQEAICMRCHYTVGPEKTAVAGVSCESCHGASKEWINVHNKFSNGAKSSADETPAARDARLGAARAAGMLSPTLDIYGVAANCFDCHTVPVEKLVNDGGHSAGSRNFDLVDRMGKIRHNFAHGGASNPPMSAERKRVVFVVGRMLAYEYAIRGYANVTGDGSYAKTMGSRVTAAFNALQEISESVRIPAVEAALAAGQKAKRAPNNAAELLAAADQIRAAGQRFAQTSGATLAAIDRVISGEPAPVAAVTEPAKSEPAAEKAAPAKATAPASAVSAPARSGGGASASVTPPVTAPAPVASASLPGEVRSRPAWFSAAGRSGYADEECTKCHKRAAAWWEDDKHHDTAARRLLGFDAKARRIAEAYGIGADGAKKPANICMGCHATVDESRKSSPAKENGVSCETCHGAGGKFFEPHQEGGNPQLGMRALKQAADRAQLCAGCHRVSDERLLAAGHSSGADFDIAQRIKKIEHWPDAKVDARRKTRNATYTALDDAALRAAFTAATSSRPIPKVTVAVAAAPATPAPAASVPAQQAPAPATPGAAVTTQPQSAAATSAAVAAAPVAPAVAAPPRTRARPLGPPPSLPSAPPTHARENVTLSLDALPPTDKLTVEQVLLLVKKRIDALDAAMGRKN